MGDKVTPVFLLRGTKMHKVLAELESSPRSSHRIGRALQITTRQAGCALNSLGQRGWVRGIGKHPEDGEQRVLFQITEAGGVVLDQLEGRADFEERERRRLLHIERQHRMGLTDKDIKAMALGLP